MTASARLRDAASGGRDCPTARRGRPPAELEPTGQLPRRPRVDEHVERMYDGDLSGQGYVAHLTRVWANSPEALGALSYVLKQASITAGLDHAHARAAGDRVCRDDRRLLLLAGLRLPAGPRGRRRRRGRRRSWTRTSALSPEERALVRWARRVSRDPSATTARRRRLPPRPGVRRPADLRDHALRRPATGVLDRERRARRDPGRRADRAGADGRASAVTYGRPPAGPHHSARSGVLGADAKPGSKRRCR